MVSYSNFLRLHLQYGKSIYSQELWAPISMLIHLNERFQHWQSGYDDSVGLSEFIYCFHKCVLFVSYISKHYKLYQTISIGRYSTWHSFESFLNWNRNQHSPEGPWLPQDTFQDLPSREHVLQAFDVYAELRRRKELTVSWRQRTGPAGETRGVPPSMWEQHESKKYGVCEVFCSFWSGPMSKMCVECMKIVTIFVYCCNRFL